jgi:hypothetical protein
MGHNRPGLAPILLWTNGEQVRNRFRTAEQPHRAIGASLLRQRTISPVNSGTQR